MTDQRSVCVRESKRAKIESCFVLHSTQHCVHKNSFFPPRDVTMDELRKQSSGWQQSLLHTFPFRSESFIIFCLCAYVYCLGLCAYIYILDFFASIYILCNVHLFIFWVFVLLLMFRVFLFVFLLVFYNISSLYYCSCVFLQYLCLQCLLF